MAAGANRADGCSSGRVFCRNRLGHQQRIVGDQNTMERDLATARHDRDELFELLSRYTDMPDLPDWIDLPKQVFAEEVEWDFTSAGAPKILVLPRNDLVNLLRPSFAGWKATHHAATGHQIKLSGDRATIHAKIRAEHWLPTEVAGDGPDRWLVVGFYDDEAIRTAQGWRLSKVKLTVTHSENDQLRRLAYRKGS
jgi:SnoaL-like domain